MQILGSWQYLVRRENLPGEEDFYLLFDCDPTSHMYNQDARLPDRPWDVYIYCTLWTVFLIPRMSLGGNSGVSWEEILSKVWKSFTLVLMCFSFSLHFFVLVQQKMEFIEITFVHQFKQSLTSINRWSILQVSAVSGFYFFCAMLLVFYHFLFCQPPYPPLCSSVGNTVSVRCWIKSHHLPAEDVSKSN